MKRSPLRLIHSDSVFESPRYRQSLNYWRGMKTQFIVESLMPERRDSLKVKQDGRVLDGNTRVKVLLDRGYNVNDLPREEWP